MPVNYIFGTLRFSTKKATKSVLNKASKVRELNKQIRSIENLRKSIEVHGIFNGSQKKKKKTNKKQKKQKKTKTVPSAFNADIFL